jgi:hypothetical protein
LQAVVLSLNSGKRLPFGSDQVYLHANLKSQIVKRKFT